MRSARSRPAHLLMMLTSLVTVWCLECAAFQPLLGALLGTPTSVMTCAGQGMTEMSGDASSIADAGTPGDANAPRVSDASNGQKGIDCGCGGSCHAPNPNASRVTLAHATPESIAAMDGLQPPSADRLVGFPPPERAAA